MYVSTVVLFVYLLTTVVYSRRVHDGYLDSYVYLNVKHTKSGVDKTVCANFLQFHTQRIAETVDEAKVYSIGWWHQEKLRTTICPLPPLEKNGSYSDKVVPLQYRIEDDGTECTRQFNEGTSSFRNATQFQIDQLKLRDAGSALFLLTKGRHFVTKWRDYLFSDFWDPYVNTSTAIPTFFLYDHVFSSILKLGNADASDLELRFFRPLDSEIDLSMLLIWIIAMACVAGGGSWAFVRHKAGKDKVPVKSSSPFGADEENTHKSCLSKHANSVAIVTLMAFLVSILMLGFFFRPLLVIVFNILLMLFGSFSVHSCLHALFSNFSCCRSSGCQSRICGIFPELSCLAHRPTCYNFFLYSFSLAVCVFWFIFRTSPYSFILLDVINITLCLHILKSLRLPSLKWISTLMLCMFLYDAIMVFVTPLWTKNGCSVMLEVATGIDCSNKNIGYPMPPIDSHLPEKFPMLMQVMHFDAMQDCYDLEVEKGYQMTILGLGDIIIPGYLVTHCFTMNGFEEKTRILYGVVCIIGYGLGLIITFLALTLMNMAQPALIYLVPSTLAPICLIALFRGEFLKMWNGVPESDNKTSEQSQGETGPLSNDGTTGPTDAETGLSI